MADEPEPKGHYVRDKDGTWQWVGPATEELRYWYERGRQDALREASSTK